MLTNVKKLANLKITDTVVIIIHSKRWSNARLIFINSQQPANIFTKYEWLYTKVALVFVNFQWSDKLKCHCNLAFNNDNGRSLFKIQ